MRESWRWSTFFSILATVALSLAFVLAVRECS